MKAKDLLQYLDNLFGEPEKSDCWVGTDSLTCHDCWYLQKDSPGRYFCSYIDQYMNNVYTKMVCQGFSDKNQDDYKFEEDKYDEADRLYTYEDGEVEYY